MLLCNEAKLFAMKTLAEQVQEYMSWRSSTGQRKYGATAFARDVASHQRDLPEAERCKRQNIDQLLARNISAPRYITALAAAMGTTVETLIAGRFQPGASAVQEPLPMYAVAPEKIRRTPVVGGSNGGLAETMWTDSDYPVGWAGEFADVASVDPNAFVAPVYGHSMIPKFMPGDYAMVEPNTSVDVDDDVMVRLDTGQVLLKILTMKNREGVTLSSYNDSGNLFYTWDQITWMYYVAYPVPRKRIKHRI